ncbi:MAG: branched-chain amino acid ABC transporter permease [Proteobacteria bacterium]|nr:branched-chain amino acid ABC transporter permease [Pseudomonadota bacterium]
MAVRSKTFRESYHEDIKLLNTLWSKAWMGAFILALVVLPFVSDDYVIILINKSCLFAVAAIGLNLLTGFSGQISLAHATFIAIGAFTATIVGQALEPTFVGQWGLSFVFTLPAGGLAAALIGLLLGIPCLRLKGLYLAMATMAFGEVMKHVFLSWDGVTGGHRGLQMPEPSVFGVVLDTDRGKYFFVVAVTALMIIAAKNIVRSRVGRAFIAIRDRDVAAEVAGVNLTAYKVMAFALSSFYAGVAGGLYAYIMGHVQGEEFTILQSVEYLAVIIVGGLGSILGAIFGAVFIVQVPELIKGLADLAAQVIPGLAGAYNEEWKVAAFGLLIMLFLIFEPGGLYAIWQRIKIGFKNWPFTY